jgi:hypothetical protein
MVRSGEEEGRAFSEVIKLTKKGKRKFWDWSVRGGRIYI